MSEHNDLNAITNGVIGAASSFTTNSVQGCWSRLTKLAWLMNFSNAGFFIERFERVHGAQLLTYLRQSNVN